MFYCAGRGVWDAESGQWKYIKSDQDFYHTAMESMYDLYFDTDSGVEVPKKLSNHSMIIVRHVVSWGSDYGNLCAIRSLRPIH